MPKHLHQEHDGVGYNLDYDLDVFDNHTLRPIASYSNEYQEFIQHAVKTLPSWGGYKALG